MVHYELVIGMDDDEEDFEDEWGDEEEGHATVIRRNEDGTKTEIGWIGGEPEDNTYYRTYSWIVSALNDAYHLGLRDERV